MCNLHIFIGNIKVSRLGGRLWNHDYFLPQVALVFITKSQFSIFNILQFTNTIPSNSNGKVNLNKQMEREVQKWSKLALILFLATHNQEYEEKQGNRDISGQKLQKTVIFLNFNLLYMICKWYYSIGLNQAFHSLISQYIEKKVHRRDNWFFHSFVSHLTIYYR